MDQFLIKGVYHIRLTTQLEPTQVKNIILKFLPLRYIITQEGFGQHQHYHCFIESQLEDTERHTKKRNILNSLGFSGNKMFSISKVRSTDQVKKYILKDYTGDLTQYHGYTSDEIKAFAQCSFKKGKSKFSEELTKLEDNYITSISNDHTSFLHSVIQLRLDYGYSIGSTSLKNYMTRLFFKKNPSYVKEYATNIIADLQLFSYG